MIVSVESDPRMSSAEVNVAPKLPNNFRTPMLIRLGRWVRVITHVFAGLGATLFVFPRLDERQRRARIQIWCERLLQLMNIRRKLQGLPLESWPGNLLILANHVSWLDIFVIDSFHPAIFVAKSELNSWPLVRHLMSGCGTVFISRAKGLDTLRVNQTLSDLLKAGECIAVFPEGTTGTGQSLLHFHSSLLQPVVDARGHIAPIAIRYLNVENTQSDSPVYVGTTSFMQSFWWALGERELTVEVTLLPLLDAENKRRRDLARDAHDSISKVLGVPSQHKMIKPTTTSN